MRITKVHTKIEKSEFKDIPGTDCVPNLTPITITFDYVSMRHKPKPTCALLVLLKLMKGRNQWRIQDPGSLEPEGGGRSRRG